MAIMTTAFAGGNTGNKASEQMKEIKQKNMAGSYTEEANGIRFTLNGV